jgi:hypothetical protein
VFIQENQKTVKAPTLKNQRMFVPMLTSIAVLAATFAQSYGQGTVRFQNLGFESANVQALPPGWFNELVAAADALPGWTAYLGGKEVSLVGHNGLTLGAENISILGPEWSQSQRIEGDFSVILQTGGINNDMEAAIAQSGTIPAKALSLRFQAWTRPVWPSATPADFIGITFNGERLKLYRIAMGERADTYALDVSTFAGEFGELKITSLITPLFGQNNVLVDNFAFSVLPVPEPTSRVLLLLGGLAALLRAGRLRPHLKD